MFLDKIIFYFCLKYCGFFLADLGVLPASLKKKICLTVFDRLPKGQMVSSKRVNFPNFLCPPSPSFSENNVAYLYQFHAQKALFKGQNLRHKFLDWKWHTSTLWASGASCCKSISDGTNGWLLQLLEHRVAPLKGNIQHGILSAEKAILVWF